MPGADLAFRSRTNAASTLKCQQTCESLLRVLVRAATPTVPSGTLPQDGLFEDDLHPTEDTDMPQDHAMSFDWIFFAIVLTPVVLALWELVRTWTPQKV